jgi:hypothetical protein
VTTPTHGDLRLRHLEPLEVERAGRGPAGRRGPPRVRHGPSNRMFAGQRVQLRREQLDRREQLIEVTRSRPAVA